MSFVIIIISVRVREAGENPNNSRKLICYCSCYCHGNRAINYDYFRLFRFNEFSLLYCLQSHCTRDYIYVYLISKQSHPSRYLNLLENEFWIVAATDPSGFPGRAKIIDLLHSITHIELESLLTLISIAIVIFFVVSLFVCLPEGAMMHANDIEFKFI